jgi:hypothetical protein
MGGTGGEGGEGGVGGAGGAGGGGGAGGAGGADGPCKSPHYENRLECCVMRSPKRPTAWRQKPGS